MWGRKKSTVAELENTIDKITAILKDIERDSGGEFYEKRGYFSFKATPTGVVATHIKQLEEQKLVDSFCKTYGLYQQEIKDVDAKIKQKLTDAKELTISKKIKSLFEQLVNTRLAIQQSIFLLDKKSPERGLENLVEALQEIRSDYEPPKPK